MLTPVGLRWHEDGVSVESCADGLEDGEAVLAAGVDDGSDGGKELAAPLGTEAVGHLAEDDTGTQRAFRGVVGVGHVAVGDEDEEVGADLGEALAQTDAVAVGRRQLHYRVHAPLEVGTVLEKRADLEPVSSLADGNGAKQEPFHHRREDVVAGIDGVLDIAKLVGEADLPILGVPLLGAEQVGNPDRGPAVSEDPLRHLLAPAGLDDVEDGIAAEEDPFPPVPPLHPGRGLVGANDGAVQNPLRDGGRLFVEARLHPFEQICQRPFADGHPEDVPEQGGQPLETDGPAMVQVDRQGLDRGAEGRAGLQTRRRRRERLPAMRAGAAVKADLGNDGLDRRQFDPLNDGLQLLIALREGRRAGRTGRGPGLDDVVGVGMQRPPDAGAAALPRFAARRLVGLVAMRGRQGRVVRRLGRLGRLVQLRLQRGHPPRQRLQLRHQFRVGRQCRVQPRPERHDQRLLFRAGKLAEVGKRWRVSHPYLDSHLRSSIKENQHLGIKPAKNTIRGAAWTTPGEQLPPRSTAKSDL